MSIIERLRQSIPSGCLRRFVLATIGLLFYVLPVFWTLIVITHNSPVNTIDGANHTNVTPAQVAKAGGYGLTFGDERKIIHSFVPKPDAQAPAGIIAAVGGMLYLFVSWFRHTDCGRLGNTFRTLIAGIIVSAVYYTLTLVSLYEMDRVRYITKDGSEISVLTAFSNQLFPNFLYVLLGLQAATFAAILLIWSVRIVPEELRPNYDPSLLLQDEKDALRKSLETHLQNWRQYGSWIIALFGGLAITVAITVVTTVTTFGGVVVQHFLAIFGSALLLMMGYVVLKIQYLEREIRNLSDWKTSQWPPGE